MGEPPFIRGELRLRALAATALLKLGERGAETPAADVAVDDGGGGAAGGGGGKRPMCMR